MGKQGPPPPPQPAPPPQPPKSPKPAQSGAQNAAQQTQRVVRQVRANLPEIPDPGSLWFPLMILILFNLFIIQFGAAHLTRAQLLWGVLTSDYSIEVLQKAGG